MSLAAANKRPFAICKQTHRRSRAHTFIHEIFFLDLVLFYFAIFAKN